MGRKADRVGGEIEYRVEIWATRRDGERLEAWSREFVGEEAAAAATVQAVTRLTRAGWMDLVILRNGRGMQLVQFQHAEILGAPPAEAKGEPAEAKDQAEDVAETMAGDGDVKLAPERGLDGNEQRMLFR